MAVVNTAQLEFWAQIIDVNDAVVPPLYAWIELQPVKTTSFAKMMASRSGTLTASPAFEANGNTLQVNTVVRMVRGYFDPVYDWVYIAQAAHAPGATACLSHINACTGEMQYLRYVNGTMLSVTNVPCEDCTSSGSGSGGALVCPCPEVECYVIVGGFSGIIGVDCSAYEALTQDIYLYQKEAGGCEWIAYPNACSNLYNPQSFWIELLYAPDGIEGHWGVVVVSNQTGVPVILAEYLIDAPDWDCVETLTQDRVTPAGSGPDEQNELENYPESISIQPCEGVWWELTSGGSCTDYTPSDTCAGAAAGSNMTLGVTYGPFSLNNFEEDWFKFASNVLGTYHVTLAWVSGTGFPCNFAATAYTACPNVGSFMSVSVGQFTSPACGANTGTPGAASSLIKVTSTCASSGSYTIRVDTGVC